MKPIARIASALVILAALVLPSSAFAYTSLYSGPGGFGFSNGHFSIAFGSGAVCGNTVCQVATTILYLINSVLVPLLFAIAFIMFLYGVAKAYIFSGGDASKREEGHKLILWGIIGFVVMISLWGLVNIVANTFGLAGYGAPPLPTSY